MPTADLIINAKLIRLFQDKPCIGSQSISLKYHHFGFVKLKHNTGYTVYKLKFRKLLNHMTRLVVHMHCTPWMCPWRCKLQLSRCHASMGLWSKTKLFWRFISWICYVVAVAHTPTLELHRRHYLYYHGLPWPNLHSCQSAPLQEFDMNNPKNCVQLLCIRPPMATGTNRKYRNWMR